MTKRTAIGSGSLLTVALSITVFASAGCTQPTRPRAAVIPAPFSQYRLPGFEWSLVRRVLLLPLWNESSDPHAAQEIRQVLGAELQSMGLCEVLIAPFDAPPEWSKRARVSGEFDEIDLVELTQTYRVDTVLCGSVSQYHAYSPPRIGLSLRLISTAEGMVVSSVDGLWDARDHIVAEDARSFYELYLTKSPAASSVDAVLGSPRLFQKYVCERVAHVLVSPGHAVSHVVAASSPKAELAATSLPHSYRSR